MDDEGALRNKVNRLINDLNDSNGEKNDPFRSYGVGVHNFVSINSRLVCVFLAMACLACLQMIVFRAHAGLVSFQGFNPTVDWSFGSMGFPQNFCRKNFIDWSQTTIDFNFQCQGQTEISSVLSSGIVSYASETDYPGLVNVFGKCYYDPSEYDANLFPYMKYFDTTAFDSELLRQCQGKNACMAQLSLGAFTSVPAAERTAG